MPGSNKKKSAARPNTDTDTDTKAFIEKLQQLEGAD